MADLLPSSTEAAAAGEGDPRVVGLDSDDADDLLSALSSETARALLAALHEDPGTPSALADRIDTSLQNAQYHLEKLEAADVIHVVDTVYSEKGREMKVYGPTAEPLVVFAGDEEQTTGLRAALSRLLSGVAVLGLLSLLVQQVFGSGLLGGGTGTDGGGGGGAAGGAGTTRAGQAPAGTTQAVEDSIDAVNATTAAAGDTVGSATAAIPPGLLFFAGGAVVLLAIFAVRYGRR